MTDATSPLAVSTMTSLKTLSETMLLIVPGELIADALFHIVAFLRRSKHGLKTDAGHRDERLIRAGYCTAATVGWPSWR